MTDKPFFTEKDFEDFHGETTPEWELRFTYDNAAACANWKLSQIMEAREQELLKEIERLRGERDEAKEEVRKIHNAMSLHAGDVCSLNNECDRLAGQVNELEEENRRLLDKVDRLENLFQTARNALDLATDLLSVPEWRQDDEWQEKERQVYEAQKKIEEAMK